MKRKLPIGIQSFEKVRTGGFVYVYKTAYAHKLASEGVPLGRDVSSIQATSVHTCISKAARWYLAGAKE